VLTVCVILGLLGVDLLLALVRPHAVGYREAAAWSVFYVSVAVVFGVVFASLAEWDDGAQYFAGYIVEKSLSVDNLFVFVIIMGTFAAPREHQQRVLVFGIAALGLRAVFVALGATLLSLLSFMFLLFGLLLIWTAVRLASVPSRTAMLPAARRLAQANPQVSHLCPVWKPTGTRSANSPPPPSWASLVSSCSVRRSPRPSPRARARSRSRSARCCRWRSSPMCSSPSVTRAHGCTSWRQPSPPPRSPRR
jgi:predicted tellurium resistance membrane protein TerC